MLILCVVVDSLRVMSTVCVCYGISDFRGNIHLCCHKPAALRAWVLASSVCYSQALFSICVTSLHTFLSPTFLFSFGCNKHSVFSSHLFKFWRWFSVLSSDKSSPGLIGKHGVHAPSDLFSRSPFLFGSVLDGTCYTCLFANWSVLLYTELIGIWIYRFLLIHWHWCDVFCGGTCMSGTLRLGIQKSHWKLSRFFSFPLPRRVNHIDCF